MTFWNRFGYAAGLAAALAFAGGAAAQGAGTGSSSSAPTQPQGAGSDETGANRKPAGERSGWGANEANRGPDAAYSGSKEQKTGTEATSDTTRSSGTGSGAERSTGSATATTDTTRAMERGAGGETKLKGDLKDGLAKLHAANQHEVHMGQMGVQQAQNDEVKRFAQRMMDEHGQNDQQLTTMAQQMNVDLQGTKAFQKKQEDAQDHMSKLQGKTGGEFDKAFMDQMVKDHEKDSKDVEKLTKEARKQNQTQLASMLDQTHQAMQNHLDEAKRIQKALDTQGGSRQARRGASGASGSRDTTSTGTGSGTSTSGADNTTGEGSHPAHRAGDAGDSTGAGETKRQRGGESTTPPPSGTKQ